MNCSASIAYSNTWLGQTTSIGTLASPLTIFTPTAQALYRLSAGSAFSTSGGVSYGVIMNGSLYSPNISDPKFSSFTFEGISGQPVQLYAQVTSGSPVFDVLVCIEQLT